MLNLAPAQKNVLRHKALDIAGFRGYRAPDKGNIGGRYEKKVIIKCCDPFVRTASDKSNEGSKHPTFSLLTSLKPIPYFLWYKTGDFPSKTTPKI